MGSDQRLRGVFGAGWEATYDAASETLVVVTTPCWLLDRNPELFLSEGLIAPSVRTLLTTTHSARILNTNLTLSGFLSSSATMIWSLSFRP